MEFCDRGEICRSLCVYCRGEICSYYFVIFFSRMEAKKEQPSPAASAPVSTSCRKKKSEEATFLEDVKDHIDEFISASMDEHATCFKKTIKKMFGMSKIVAERNSESKEVESSLPLRTTVAD